MRRWRNPLSSLFGHRRREDYLAKYVIRECSRGRALEDVLEDRYVVNRSTPSERARLLDRPEVVAATRGTGTAEIRRPEDATT